MRKLVFYSVAGTGTFYIGSTLPQYRWFLSRTCRLTKHSSNMASGMVGTRLPSSRYASDFLQKQLRHEGMSRRRPRIWTHRRRKSLPWVNVARPPLTFMEGECAEYAQACHDKLANELKTQTEPMNERCVGCLANRNFTLTALSQG